jgi:hypothetical protein
MNKTNKILSVLLMLVFTASLSFSQSKISFHAGASFPVSDFGSTNIENEDAKGAATGINFGLNYLYPIGKSGLAAFAGVDFMFNPTSNKYQDEIYASAGAIFSSAGTSFDISFSRYFSIPISVGLQYEAPITDKITLFGNAGLTASFLKISDQEMNLNLGFFNIEMKEEFDMANSFGFKIGAGVLFDDKISLGLNYFNMGKYSVSRKTSLLTFSQNG